MEKRHRDRVVGCLGGQLLFLVYLGDLKNSPGSVVLLRKSRVAVIALVLMIMKNDDL